MTPPKPREYKQVSIIEYHENGKELQAWFNRKDNVTVREVLDTDKNPVLPDTNISAYEYELLKSAHKAFEKKIIDQMLSAKCEKLESALKQTRNKIEFVLKHDDFNVLREALKSIDQILSGER